MREYRLLNVKMKREKNNNERRGFHFGFGSHRLCQGRLVVCRRLPKLFCRSQYSFGCDFGSFTVLFYICLVNLFFNIFLLDTVYSYSLWCFVLVNFKLLIKYIHIVLLFKIFIMDRDYHSIRAQMSTLFPP